MSASTTPKLPPNFATECFRNQLLAFYAQYGRTLPWRAHSGAYEIWLSEIMLQQTTVAAVIPYYLRFLETFPTVEALAAADEQQVYTLWQGLGYYSRARNLLKCAQTVVAEQNGRFPQTEAELLKLAGIGPYTAAAIAAMAFNQPASVVDGNVERVISRLFRIEAPLPASKPAIKALAQQLACPQQPKAYANAIMELGAVVCTPKNPSCTTCPVRQHCASAGKDDAATFPRKSPKAAKPVYHGQAFVIRDTQGRIFLQQRPAKGLLANLWEVPSQNWRDAQALSPEIQTCIHQHQSTTKACGSIKHVFTHFTLNLDVYLIEGAGIQLEAFTPDNLPPLPNLMQKVLQQAAVPLEF